MVSGTRWFPSGRKGSSYAVPSLMYEEKGTSIPTGNSHAIFSTRVRRTTTRGTAGSMTRTGPVAVSTALGATR